MINNYKGGQNNKDNSANWNIFQQLRRAADLKGWTVLEFKNEENLKITQESAKIIIHLLEMYKPQQRLFICEEIVIKENFQYLFNGLHTKEI